MLSHKKAILWLGLVVGSVNAVSYDVASNQRIVDAFVKVVVLSDETKVQAMNFLFSLGLLCGEQVKFVFKAAMKEVQPQDAQRLLVILDKVDALVEKWTQYFNEMKTRTLEQQYAMMADLQYDAETILFDLVEFGPAFEKYQTVLEEQAGSEDNQRAFILIGIKVIVAVLHDVRVIVEQKGVLLKA